MKFRLMIFAFCLPAVIFAESSTDKSRVWTSSKGDKVTAEYVKEAYGKVQLKKSDGETLTISVGALCAADQKYLKEMKAQTSSASGSSTLSFSSSLSKNAKDDDAKYSAKKRFGKGDFNSRVSYIAAAPDNTLYALESSGTVHKYDVSMKGIGKFDTGMKNTQALAISESGEVFVFSTNTRQEEREYNNRKYKVDVPVGVEYKVFDKNDKELRSKKLDDVMGAQAVHFIGDKLVVADNGKRVIRIIDPESGKETASIGGLRLCCGIFDFCEGPDNTIAVSNLGAFQLQCYDLKGKKVSAFGKRGKDVDDFHGCCNPVSAGYLSNGRVLTVEKSPTRIKIYDAKGKKATEVQNVEELVQGCSYIPVAVNSNDEVFLAANGSAGTYLVKCEK